jgi:endoglucanase
MGIPTLCVVMAMLCLPSQDTLSPGGAPPGKTGISDARYARFSRGVNLPGWLWLNRGPVEELEKRFSDEDLKLIQSLGLTCVRVPVDMAKIHDPGAPGSLRPRELGILERGLERILASGLAVIFDLHSISQAAGGSDYSGPLGRDEGFTDVFIAFWEVLAVRLARFDPERLIIEPMNEPVLLGQEEKWPPLQERIVKAIRAKAPDHTILATGAFWSNIHTLVRLRPLDDPNILYNFHFYEPHIFTHQGATWSMEIVKPLREIPYPSSPEAVAPAVSLQKHEEVRRGLRAYGEERWDAARIEQEIGKAAAWAATHGVRLLCNEWGCYRNYAPPASRVAWTRDVRTALESHGIGWCMWEFDQSFGLVTRENGRAVVDRELAAALGLKIDGPGERAG